MQTTFSPLSFGKSFMKIRSAVPENGCLVFCGERKRQKKNICKTYTHLPYRRLRKKVVGQMENVDIGIACSEKSSNCIGNLALVTDECHRLDVDQYLVTFCRHHRYDISQV